MSNKDVCSMMNIQSDSSVASNSKSSKSAHLQHSGRRNNQAELTGGFLQSSEVVHSLMLEISAVSPHIKVASINKR